MINWREISKVGLPKNDQIGYLVSDGENVDYSGIELWYDSKIVAGKIKYEPNGNGKWIGGSVYANYEEVSGTTFDFYPTHWCPETELNLPKK